MKTVYRYELKEAVNDIELPIGAEILSSGIATQQKYEKDEVYPFAGPKLVTRETISIWAKVDTTASSETRRFLVFGTGADMDEVTNFETKFIGTVQKKNAYAFHIFEVKDNI